MRNNILRFFLLSLLISLPVVFINIQYLDDIARTAIGYYGWLADGRPLTELFYFIVSGGGRVVDLYPITQILAYGLISFSCFFICLKFDVFGWHALSISSVAIFSPLLLGNMLFRYDSITMSMAFLISTLGFYYKNNNSIKSILYQAILVASGMCFYQASLGVFISLTICLCIFLIKDESLLSTLKYASKNAISAIIGFALYKGVASLSGIGAYASSKSEIIPFTKSGINNFFDASLKSIDILLSSINNFTLLATFVFLIASLFYSYINNNERFIARVIRLFISLNLIILLFASSFIIVSVVKNPPLIARSFMSFGLVIMGYLLIINKLLNKNIASVIAIFIAITSLGTDSKILSAVKYTSEKQNYISSTVSSVLSKDKKATDITVIGWIKTPYLASKLTLETPFIKKINWTYIDNQFFPSMLKYHGLDIKSSTIKDREDILKNERDWVMLYGTSEYDLYQYKNHAILKAKN